MTTPHAVFAGKTCQPISARSFPTARIGLALASSLLLATSAQAAPNTWGGTTSGDWSVGSNWGSGVVPTATTAATFSNAVNTSVSITAPSVTQSVIFTGAGTGAFTISGSGANVLTLANGGTISTDSTIVNSEAINAPLTIGANGTAAAYSFSNGATSSSNVLNIGGTVTGAASTGNTILTIRGTNFGNNTISGVISNGTAGGTLGVTKLDAGVWTLSGNNTYSGGTSVTGTLNINAGGTSSANSAIGTGALTIVSGSVIDNTSAGDVTLGTANAVTFSSFTFGGTHNLTFGAGAVSINQVPNTVTLGGTGSVLTFGGVATNTNGSSNITLTVNGVGNTLSLGGYNISNGSTNKNLTINGTANVNITGIVADNSVSSPGSQLTFGGTGKLTLSGANTFTGLTSVNGGGVVDYKNGVGFGTNSAITVSNGSTVQVEGGIIGGSQLLKVSGAGATGSTGALENVSGTNSYGGSVTLTGTTTVSADAGRLTLSGIVTGSGSGAMVKAGAGTVELSGTNTYSSGTTISAGTLLANNATSSTGTGAVNVNGGTLGGTGKISTSNVTGAGTIAVNVASGATLNPGDGLTAGHLTLELKPSAGTKANLANGSLLAFDLGANTASSDELIVTGGTLVLNNKGFSDFTFNALTTLTNGTTYTLMSDVTGITGTLGTATGLFGNGMYSGTLILSGTDLELQIAVVPEPGTWAMLLGGVALLVVVRRRGARQI